MPSKCSVVATRPGNLQARASIAIQLAVLPHKPKCKAGAGLNIIYHINIAPFTALNSVLSTLHFIQSSQREVAGQTDQ